MVIKYKSTKLMDICGNVKFSLPGKELE